jgi:hypothetical protein
VLSIDGFDVARAAGVPRQKPDAIGFVKWLFVYLTQIAATLQIERRHIMAQLAQRLDQRRSDQSIAT